MGKIRYGSPPGNESLTAYGLLEMLDMKKVFPVEDKLLKQLNNFLLSRKSKTGFERTRGRYGFGKK